MPDYPTPTLPASGEGGYKTSTFNFPITEEHIAQHPSEKRDGSWLMVLDRKKQSREHKVFADIIDYLNPGDLLVLNNTKVIPARLLGKKNGNGANCELLLLKDLGNDRWEVLARPGKRLQAGTKIIFGNNELTAEIISDTDFGGKIVKFSYSGQFYPLLEKIGLIPLPPYIKEHQNVQATDVLAERYQTVYAEQAGAAAAPTAGLHFTSALLEKIKSKKINIEYVTLHTGLGTFRPVATEDVREHDIHQEWFSISQATMEKIRETKNNEKRVIAVGTTVVRVLETVQEKILTEKTASNLDGFTKIYIYPGYEFKIIDALITNFHLPMSTLLVLVCAFAGKEFVMESYLEALAKKYRFYSFGDAMFIK